MLFNLKLISLRREGRDSCLWRSILVAGQEGLTQSWLWSPAVYPPRSWRVDRPSHSVDHAFGDAAFVARRLIDRPGAQPTDLCYSSAVYCCCLLDGERLPMQPMVKGFSHGICRRSCAAKRTDKHGAAILRTYCTRCDLFLRVQLRGCHGDDVLWA